MPTPVAVSRRAVLGLWSCLTLAALGFVLLLNGLLADRYDTLWGGGALMAFGFMLYLFLHFWATASAAYAADARAAQPEPRRTAPRPAKPASDAPRLFDEAVGWQASAAKTEATVHAAAAENPVPMVVASNGHARPERPTVSAVERRKDWIDQMPLAKSILDTPAPPPAPAEVPEGKTRGRCGGCSTVLIAPATRPLRLRCPTCGRVAWLK